MNATEKKSMPVYWRTILWALLCLLLLETALQVRSHLRYGTSVLNALRSETTYVTDEATGLKVLRPSATIKGAVSNIQTNSLGLRSPEISAEKPAGAIRLAVVGASSVMGTYTRNNEEILSYQLDGMLKKHYITDAIEVINAGIAGYLLEDQQRMIEEILLPLGIDAIVLYAGFNDLSSYCFANSPDEEVVDYSLHTVEPPSWFLLVELITKNTVWLRQTRAGGGKDVEPVVVDTVEYEEDLQALMASVEAAGIPMLVATNPRAYSREMPFAEQETLSATARYYNPCFSIADLHDLYDNHNELIARAAADHGFPVFRLDQAMPHGTKYFGDATHFTTIGTTRAAELLMPELTRVLDPLLLDPPPGTPLFDATGGR